VHGAWSSEEEELLLFLLRSGAARATPAQAQSSPGGTFWEKNRECRFPEERRRQNEEKRARERVQRRVFFFSLDPLCRPSLPHSFSLSSSTVPPSLPRLLLLTLEKLPLMPVVEPVATPPALLPEVEEERSDGGALALKKRRRKKKENERDWFSFFPLSTSRQRERKKEREIEGSSPPPHLQSVFFPLLCNLSRPPPPASEAFFSSLLCDRVEGSKKEKERRGLLLQEDGERGTPGVGLTGFLAGASQREPVLRLEGAFFFFSFSLSETHFFSFLWLLFPDREFPFSLSTFSAPSATSSFHWSSIKRSSR